MFIGVQNVDKQWCSMISVSKAQGEGCIYVSNIMLPEAVSNNVTETVSALRTATPAYERLTMLFLIIVLNSQRRVDDRLFLLCKSNVIILI